MKQIPLTKGLFALVDDEDYKKLSKHRWQATKGGHTFYATRSVYGNGTSKTIGMHREILQLPANEMVDHRDGDGLNNRRSNLRSCSYSGNGSNSRLYKNNTSGYRGVHRDKRRHKWYTQIKVEGKTIHLGAFTCPIKAAKCYDDAAEKYHGEFASLNFKEQGE